ncbi:MAG: hypothetical protein WBJ75_04015 [Pseudohongiellaceae bacterium]|nr:MAG: hypothetical protein A3H44_01860 [Gammaproteobacteria bacterium RIFCSPLOWO2_02_FULL_57_10]
MLTLLRQLPALLASAVNPARLRVVLLLLGTMLLTQCTVVEVPYKAYAGEPRPAAELAMVSGDVYYRKDWLNSYVDAVRFMRIDGHEIENSRDWEHILLAPGERELEVYYSWDMGARIGLAPALVSYASNRESMSRKLRIRAEAGKTYSVKAEPVFNGDPGDIGSLAHVDFWVEDSDGRVVLSKEEGRFRPAR